MTTWRKEIADAMKVANDDTPVVHSTLSEDEAGAEFDNGWGGTNGQPFALWTEARVYFPICYDGSEWVGSAPRNPSAEKCEHQGGG